MDLLALHNRAEQSWCSGGTPPGGALSLFVILLSFLFSMAMGFFYFIKSHFELAGPAWVLTNIAYCLG